MRTTIRLDRERIALFEALLVPVGIGRRRYARLVQPAHLVGGQGPADRAEVFTQLRLNSRADDHAGDRRTLQQPVERDLGDPISAVLCSRLCAGNAAPRRILPVNRPQPSGLQTTADTFWSRPSGISSHS